MLRWFGYLGLNFFLPSIFFATDVAITMDDFRLTNDPLLTGIQKDRKILKMFAQQNAKAALFVIGEEIERPITKGRLVKWDTEGHLIGNHTYSHPNYRAVTFDTLAKEILRTDALIRKFTHFAPLFRYPQLFEGESEEKRDRMRTFLARQKYKNGYVTIDASDWYVNQRLIARLQKDRKADLKPYRDFYLKHIWERSQFYDGLAKKVWKKEVKHTLLVHHNLVNALFLSDVIDMYRRNQWRVIDAADAFRDPIFDEQPKIVPAGQSIVWALAKASKKCDSFLRYPGEDGPYEKAEMDKLGL